MCKYCVIKVHLEECCQLVVVCGTGTGTGLTLPHLSQLSHWSAVLQCERNTLVVPLLSVVGNICSVLLSVSVSVPAPVCQVPVSVRPRPVSVVTAGEGGSAWCYRQSLPALATVQAATTTTSLITVLAVSPTQHTQSLLSSPLTPHL